MNGMQDTFRNVGIYKRRAVFFLPARLLYVRVEVYRLLREPNGKLIPRLMSAVA